RDKYELTCELCGTNSHSDDRARYLKGIRGFKGHYSYAHSSGVTYLRLEEFCHMRPISVHDEDLLELRMHPTDRPIAAVEPRDQEKSAVLQPQTRSSVGVARGEEGIEENTNNGFAAPVACMSAAADFEDDVDMKGLFSDSEGD
ncbi:hypothetical protein LTR95_019426, partial [Oleoguttula sp. CCFEE 5521]